VEEDTLKDDLIACIDVLNEREREVVSRYYGLKGWRQTMAEIGEDMDLKRERVRQERDKAVRKLRKAAKSKVDEVRGKM
jgi:RNA polymerase primary sigma factor